jgi:glycogen synthase
MSRRMNAMLPGLPPSRVVRNCVEVAEIRRSAIGASLPEGWPVGDEPTVLFLGRSERRKGVSDGVAAFGELWRRMPAARLVLAGAGGDARFEPTRAALLASLPEPARERVTWLGHVGGPELYAAIGRADVAMAPSRWEGFGNVALEVKALATPLVVTSGSGFDDFCEHEVDCLMVSPGDATALGAALVRTLADPVAARARAERASARVEAFAPDPVAADLRIAADLLLGQVRPH